MFESLSQRLTTVFDKLTGRGALSEADVTEALREVRVALLEADVALPVVKDFVARVKDRAVGQEVVKSVTPGQMVVKIVHDELIATLGKDGTELNLNTVPPAVILMVGLQGSGKTTTSGKLAVRLKKERKKVLLASLDVYRPAAQQQLEILARQAEVGSLPIVMGEMPVAITRRALDTGRKEGYDVVILDTAGRLHIDQELMAEVAQVRDVAKPVETLLVVDAMTGQDAVTLAREFNEKVGVTGTVLTRVDGDARGGAALSMRAVTGRPIKFLGLGEKLDALEPFHPDRLAGRILGMGDVVSLVEKAIEHVDQEEAEKLAKRIEKGKFDLNDMLNQFKQVEKMGDLKGIIGMLPGIGRMADQLKDAKIDNKMLARQKAIIQSMTPAERRNPDLIKASRKRRIAAGSGLSVQDVNKLLKQYQQMADMMKKVGKMGQKGLMRHGLGSLMPPGFGGGKRFGR
ncbi:MAG: signal recognition particle protein [Pseudomonadota bacterium]